MSLPKDDIDMIYAIRRLLGWLNGRYCPDCIPKWDTISGEHEDGCELRDCVNRLKEVARKRGWDLDQCDLSKL